MRSAEQKKAKNDGGFENPLRSSTWKYTRALSRARYTSSYTTATATTKKAGFEADTVTRQQEHAERMNHRRAFVDRSSTGSRQPGR